MDSGELIELFYNRTYEKFVNKQILDDKNYIVPRQQLTNYVHELVSIPFIDFINYFRCKGIERRVEVSDVTQFASFTACEIEMCNALIWANNPGCQYLDIGRYFPNNNIAKSDSTYRRYGEKHIKASTQLGLTFMYYDYWYLSCLGYIYPDLDKDVRKQLLARTITRNRLYQQLLVDILDHDVNPEEYINMLPEYIMRRSLRCVYAFLEMCLVACKEENIKTHNLIKNQETFKSPAGVQLPSGTNKNLRTYFDEFDYRSLSRDSTADLINRFKKGDCKAYEILVKGYMRLVVNIAKLYNQQGVELEDLIQEGTLGLIKAFEHYNVNVNVLFSKYASWWIMQAITQANATLPHIVQIPLNTLSLHRRLRNFVDSFEQERGFLPSVNDIDIYEMNDLEWLNYIYQLPPDLKEMTRFVDDFDIYESNELKPDTFQEKEYKQFLVKRLLRYLDNRNQIILTKFFGLDGNRVGETLDSIGDYLGLTRERVRQIVELSIRQLRDLSGIKREEAKIGDLIRLGLSKQVGKVVTIKKAIDGSAILVLKMDTGETEEVSANDSSFEILQNTIKKKPQNYPPPAIVIQTKEKKQTIQKKTQQSESDVQCELNVLDNVKVGDIIIYGQKSCTICKIFVRGSSSKFLVKYENGVLDYVPNNKSLYRKALPQISRRNSEKKDFVTKHQDIKEVLVGDRIVYDYKLCTVIEKKTMRGSHRLVVKYDDGTIDNLQNDRNRYRVI